MLGASMHFMDKLIRGQNLLVSYVFSIISVGTLTQGNI